MKRILCFVFLYVVRQISGVEDDIICSKHEVEDLCVMPISCQPTCLNPEGQICFLKKCNKGCSCKKGLLRNEETNECVPPHICPKVCGKNEEWTPCGAACTQTCQSLENPPFCPSSQACSAGCVCTKGFIRDEESQKCIPFKRCLKGIRKD